MEKKRTFLTPEEVQEFINLGVDFGETTCMWVKTSHSIDSYTLTASNIWMPDTVEANKDKWNEEDLAAPSLFELLAVLPKQLIRYGEICRLCLIWNGNAQVWHAGYQFRAVSWYDDFCPCDSNPLIVVADLLRWVCKNHPETLTKEEKGGSNE